MSLDPKIPHRLTAALAVAVLVMVAPAGCGSNPGDNLPPPVPATEADLKSSATAVEAGRPTFPDARKVNPSKGGYAAPPGIN
ncbi:hypothetical protein Isop_2468 [Isosphaera pallida ATCC 43644]|uniref:Lipoprotein n=1 Tax=Isosphaera pallida (strain ATCC 43644 / DSM 9630 / IS1B) TaxID=575540 RepID=E8QXJ3_ISOPI|nr:hypothetical protein [Isosphaera pallida]ADV63041.1 hypothetical protein Isop_2468 [Isosphaera pallida ATCC 43644]